MRTVTIGIGLPGSGKTTMLKKLAQTEDAEYVCPDDIRLEITGDINNQEANEQVWQTAYQRITRALAIGHSVVVDATNAKRPNRLDLIAHCRPLCDRLQGVWFVTPARLCLERNRERDRVVPEFVMGVMAGWLEAYPPDEAEGFDVLVKVEPSP